MMRALACSLATLLALSCATPQQQSPDYLFTNGLVRTPSGWAEAMAVANGVISAIGSTAVLENLAGAETRVVDLSGRVILPGLHDMHVHPIFGGVTSSGADYTHCRIEQGSTVDQLVASVSECVARVQPEDWVTGGQWDAFTLGVTPHRSILDKVSTDIPILINDTSGHSAWANSKALELAGIDTSTADPEGGIFERDDQGIPTGVLRESAIGMVRGKAPSPSDKIIRDSLRWALDNMLSYGVTAYVDASSGFVAGGESEAKLYAQLADEGLLKHRVRLCMNWLAGNWQPDGVAVTSVIENRHEYERDRLKLDCVKLFLDGVPTDGHTAAMLEPYADTLAVRDDEASRYGMLLMGQLETNELVTRLDAQGLIVKFHVAGDAAVRSALDAIEAARNANGMNGPRHSPGHCTFIAKEDLTRAKNLNATFEMSPYLWAPSPINDDIAKAIGTQRIERVWPFREAIDAGALVVPGSDWAVVPSVNPWLAIEALVTREAPGGSEQSFGKAQAITIEEAIDLFTINSAIQMGMEGKTGQLVAGMLADLIVIDRNPYEILPTELHRVEVDLTMIQGEVVYERN